MSSHYQVTDWMGGGGRARVELWEGAFSEDDSSEKWERKKMKRDARDADARPTRSSGCELFRSISSSIGGLYVISEPVTYN